MRFLNNYNVKMETMKYTRNQVGNMSSMTYLETMCQELKKAGFHAKQRGNRPPHEYEPHDAVFGGDIVFNIEAVCYLRNIGLLDNGKCPMCNMREDRLEYALSYQMVQHFMYVKIVISNMLGKKNKSVGVLVV